MSLMRLAGLCAVVLGIGFCAAAVKAAPAEPGKIKIEQETLANGLHVIYAPLHQAPVVHVRVVYHVGSRDERPDRQGFAHMFEHMMFRGSAHVKPQEHMKLIGTVGGNCNAFTGFDTTQYVNTLPSQYLPLALWLEADRMSSFKVSDPIYKTERNVVAEEWRMRMNQPYGDIFDQLMKRVFVKSSYRWTPIGNMDDLRRAPSSALQKFFNKYYVPNNATLIIAGDFDPRQAKAEVHNYFAWIPEGAKIERNIPAEPKQTEAREATIDEAVPLDAVIVAYKLPKYRSNDRYAMDLLSTILGTGDSSRVRRLLVNGKSPMAVDAYAVDEQLEDGGVFGVGAIVMRGKDPRIVRQKLSDMIDGVVKNGVTADELEKAKNLARIGLIEGRKTADDLASEIADEAVLGGDAAAVNDQMRKIDAVTLDDIKRVAAKYLSPDEATTLEVQPSLLAAADKAAANQTAEALKNAPVAAATEPVAPPHVDFPSGYPATPPTASARANPKFEKGTECEIDGVKVIVMPDRRLPLVSWSLTMRRGSQSDPAGKEGAAWLTDEMVRRGVTGMSFNELTKDLDSRGITITVGDGGDHTQLFGSCTTDQLDHAIERSGQILHEPTFPPDQFAKLKAQSIDSLRLAQDSPTTVAGNELTHAIYGDSVLGRYSTPQSVARITLNDVKDFYKTFYRPNDAIFLISGDVSVERGQELAHKLLDGWQAGDLPPVKYEQPKKPTTRRIILVDRPRGAGATVRMAIPAYDIHASVKFAGSVANQVLNGSGIAGPLMEYVRAKKGLCYDCRAYFSPNRQAGVFHASVDTKTENAAPAIEAMFKVMRDIRDGQISDEQIADARSRVSGGMVMGMQTIAQQASYRVKGILNGYPIDYYDNYPKHIDEVSKDQVRQVMQQFVNVDAMTIVVVAPAAEVKPALEKLGKVEVIPMPDKRTGTATSRPLAGKRKKAA